MSVFPLLLLRASHALVPRGGAVLSIMVVLRVILGWRLPLTYHFARCLLVDRAHSRFGSWGCFPPSVLFALHLQFSVVLRALRPVRALHAVRRVPGLRLARALAAYGWPRVFSTCIVFYLHLVLSAMFALVL